MGLQPDRVLGRPHGEVALDESWKLKVALGSELVSARELKGGRNAQADLHAATVRQHGETLHEDAVGAGTRDEDGVALGPDDVLVGGSNLRRPCEGSLTFFAVHPQSEPGHHAAVRQGEERTRFATLPGGRVVEGQGPFGVSESGSGIDLGVEAR